MSTHIFTFQSSTEVIYGIGALDKLPEKIAEFGANKILIVTDKGVVNAGLLDLVRREIDVTKHQIDVFDEVQSDPTIGIVEKGRLKARELGAELIIALGGGSAIDSAKAIGIMATNEGEVKGYWMEGKPITKPKIPLIAIPTTAGTGSEVTKFAVLTDPETKFKFGIGSKYLVPEVAIVDPALTVTLPPSVTASTGLDALTHAIEAYTNTATNYLTDALAIQAIKLIGRSLRIAVAKGDNLQARDDMLMGSLLAGMAFGNGYLGIVHALAHPLGGFFHISHGVANAVLLPYVMEYNLMGNPERYAHIAELLGERIDGLSLSEAASRAVEAVRKLNRDVGIPKTLAELGVKEEAFADMARDAMKNRNIRVNPRDVRCEDLIEIYRWAFYGSRQ